MRAIIMTIRSFAIHMSTAVYILQRERLGTGTIVSSSTYTERVMHIRCYEHTIQEELDSLTFLERSFFFLSLLILLEPANFVLSEGFSYWLLATYYCSIITPGTEGTLLVFFCTEMTAYSGRRGDT